MQYTVKLRKPHAKQQIFIDSKLKRKIIRAGRRGGKTTGIAIAALLAFLDGRRVLYAVPVADQIRVFWREIVNALGELIEVGVFTKNETEHFVEKPGTKQRIKAKTAWNADSLRGDFADLLILDEFQLMDEDAWGEVGAPMLLDNNGDAVFIYTPPSLHSKSVSKARDPRHAAKMFKFALANPDRWLALHFTSHDNPHISQDGLSEVTADMSALAYRQEILAEDIEEIPGALWTRDVIERTRVRNAPEVLERIIVGVDPSGSTTNEAGIVAVGRAKDGHGYVMRDRSLKAPSPKSWAAAAVAVYHELLADRVVAERNYGGDMVKEMIHGIDKYVSYKEVTASRSKQVRAEPITSLFEQGRMHIVGSLPELEDEMVSFVPGISKSPNRMDAMVWAATEAMLGPNLGIFEYAKREAEENLSLIENRPVLSSAEILEAHRAEDQEIAREEFRRRMQGVER